MGLVLIYFCLLGTIFAYGQTSSGKTYTMMGNANAPGLICLAICNLFNVIKDVSNTYMITAGKMLFFGNVTIFSAEVGSSSCDESSFLQCQHIHCSPVRHSLF